jgi:hypothetical protein
MDKPCPFWPDDRACASRECGIENCDDKVPDALKVEDTCSKRRGAGDNVGECLVI